LRKTTPSPLTYGAQDVFYRRWSAALRTTKTFKKARQTDFCSLEVHVFLFLLVKKWKTRTRIKI
jgi:hypothetical protein